MIASGRSSPARVCVRNLQRVLLSLRSAEAQGELGVFFADGVRGRGDVELVDFSRWRGGSQPRTPNPKPRTQNPEPITPKSIKSLCPAEFAP